MKNLILIACFFITFSAKAQNLSLTKIWETNELPVPESVLVAPGQHTLYVSLIDGAGNIKDGQGGIAILNADGTIKDRNWVKGLHAPKGMAIYNNILYVADLDVVYGIDTASANIIKTIKVPDAVFLNDIAINSRGIVFVSDTRTNKIHRIENNESAVYLDNVKAANGLKFINEQLYVLSDSQLLLIGHQKNRKLIAEGLEKSGDGLEVLKNGDFIVSCWAGIIYHIKPDGTKHKLLDVQGKMNTADIAYDARKRILYVPTFNGNSVVGYQVNFN